MMPRILAYHPEFLVDVGGRVVRLSLSMDDWYSDDEVFEQLAGWTGAATLGGAVAAIRNNNTPGDRGNIMSARIEGFEGEPGDGDVWGGTREIGDI